MCAMECRDPVDTNVKSIVFYSTTYRYKSLRSIYRRNVVRILRDDGADRFSY